MATTRNGILIDRSGVAWPDSSRALTRRLGRPQGALAERAVQLRGFIHVRRADRGIRITLKPGRFSMACLAGTLQLLNELQPDRIIACLRSDSATDYEIFATIFDFIARAERLANGASVVTRPSRRAAIDPAKPSPEPLAVRSGPRRGAGVRPPPSDGAGATGRGRKYRRGAATE